MPIKIARAAKISNKAMSGSKIPIKPRFYYRYVLGNHHYLRIHDVYQHHDDLDCYVHHVVYV